MKKTLWVLALLAIGTLASCSYYTCPTYAKKATVSQTPGKRI